MSTLPGSVDCVSMDAVSMARQVGQGDSTNQLAKRPSGGGLEWSGGAMKREISYEGGVRWAIQTVTWGRRRGGRRGRSMAGGPEGGLGKEGWERWEEEVVKAARGGRVL